MGIGEEWDDQGPNKNTTFQERLDEAKANVPGASTSFDDILGAELYTPPVVVPSSPVVTPDPVIPTPFSNNINPSMTSGVDRQTIALPSIPSISK